MITISTGGIGPMDIMSSTKAKGASKEEEKAGDAFASLMNMVSTRQEQPEITSSQDVDVTEVAPAKDTTKDYEAYSKQENVETAKDKYQDTEKTTVKEDTQASKTKETDTKVSQDESTVDKAVALIKEVKLVLKDTLGLSDEELDSLLADMGIDISQLLLGDNLKNFILQTQGATNVDLLVNENLANLVNDITAKVADIVQEFGFVQDADFEMFLANNAETIEAAIQNEESNVDIIIDDKAQLKTNDVSKIVSEDVEVNNDEAIKQDTKVSNEQVNSKVGDNGIADKLTVEATSEDGQAMAQDQTADQSNQQLVTNFNQALDNTVNNNTNIDATAFTSTVQEADIIRQIIDQIKVTAGKEIQSVEVQLNPENLGKVYVNVEAKDGVMQAKIIAETEAAKNAIENNLAVLKENFSNNEIKVDAIEVMVAAYGFFEESSNEDFDNQEQANDTSKSVGGINVNNLDEELLTEEEELEVEIMKSKGNTVSYTV